MCVFLFALLPSPRKAQRAAGQHQMERATRGNGRRGLGAQGVGQRPRQRDGLVCTHALLLRHLILQLLVLGLRGGQSSGTLSQCDPRHGDGGRIKAPLVRAS